MSLIWSWEHFRSSNTTIFKKKVHSEQSHGYSLQTHSPQILIIAVYILFA